MSQNATDSTGGIGFFGLLSIILITLKLLDKIDITWFWAVFPLFIPALLVLSLYWPY